MRAALLALLVAAVVTVSVPAAPAGAATPGTLAGTVTRGGAPLAGAPVWIYRADAQVQVAATATAVDGTWARSLAPGAYRVLVWASAAGLPPTWYPGSPLWADAGVVHVSPGGTTTTHQAVAEAASLHGVVTSGGQPLAGVTVHAWWNGVRHRSTTTATDGTYVLGNLVPGPYAVSATDPTGAHDTRYHPSVRDAARATRVAATPGVTGGVDVDLRAAGALTGRVTSPDGTPVAGLPVGALDIYGIQVQHATTAADGTYALIGLPSGSYRVLVWPSGPWAGAYAPDAQDFEGGTPQPVVAGTTRTGVDAVVATTADHPVPPYQGDAGAPKVALIGDSITRSSTSVHHARLDPDWWVSSVGIGGRRTDEMAGVADRFAATDPDQVVINLGSNDAHQGVSPAAVVTNLTALVDRFPAADCVHLVTITTSTADEAAAARARQVNDGIRALAAARPQVRVVDWAGALATNLAAGGPTWSFDNLHPAGEGRQALATLLADALAGCAVPDGRIVGVVREDVDGDGAAEAAEPGQAEVLVQAWRDGDGDGEPEVLVASTTTAADGTYELAGLAPDGYRVALDAGQVAPAVGSPGELDVVVAAGATVADADLGLGLPATGRGHGATTFPATETAMLRDVVVLPSGDVVVAGRFDDQLRLGSGAPAATLSGAGGSDGFVAVLDPSGQPRWAQRIGGPTDDDVIAVAIGPGGEVAVAGTLGTTGTVGDGTGATVAVPAARDAVTAVFEADGTLRWIRTASGIGPSLGLSVAFTPDGQVVAGTAFVDRVDVGEGLHLDSAGTIDSVVVVRDGVDGRALRTVQLTGPGIELATGVSPTPDGRVVVTGLAGTGSVLRGGGTTMALTGVGSLDALVAVVDPAGGTPVAGRLVGSTGGDRALRSTVDPTTGDVYVVADVAGPTTVDGQAVASATAGVVLALDPALGLRWAVAAHAPATTMVDVAVHDGSVVAVGGFRGRVEVGGQVRHAAHGDDGLLVELDTDGALLDVDVLAGGWGDELLAAADHDLDGGIVAVGAFTVSATMGRGPGSVALAAEGIQDGVLVRLAP